MEEIIIGLVSSIVGIWLTSIERRLKTMDARLREAPSREETDHLIDLKQEATKAVQEEIKADIIRVETKIDRLIDLHINRSSK